MMAASRAFLSDELANMSLYEMLVRFMFSSFFSPQLIHFLLDEGFLCGPSQFEQCYKFTKDKNIIIIEQWF